MVEVQLVCQVILRYFLFTGYGITLLKIFLRRNIVHAPIQRTS